MKLLTNKEIEEGLYRDIPIDDTVTAKVWKRLTVILMFISCLIPFFHKMSLTDAFIGICGVMLYFIISLPLVRYFVLCETYVGRDDGGGYDD